MTRRAVSDPLVREAPLLRVDTPVQEGVRLLVESQLPALPVVDAGDALRGVFGEREFFAALFPAYLRELKYAAFVPRSLEPVLEKRTACRQEPVGAHMTTDHVDVGVDASDVQVAETFLHHRVLILPVVDEGSVTGVITRAEFFRALAERFLAAPPA